MSALTKTFCCRFFLVFLFFNFGQSVVTTNQVWNFKSGSLFNKIFSPSSGPQTFFAPQTGFMWRHILMGQYRNKTKKFFLKLKYPTYHYDECRSWATRIFLQWADPIEKAPLVCVLKPAGTFFDVESIIAKKKKRGKNRKKENYKTRLLLLAVWKW